jgi:hypothetical protein
MAGAIVGKQDILFWATANSMDPGGYVARTGHFAPTKSSSAHLCTTLICLYSTTDSPLQITLFSSFKVQGKRGRQAGIRLQGSASQHFRRDAAMPLYGVWSFQAHTINFSASSFGGQFNSTTLCRSHVLQHTHKQIRL